ncbi:MAG: hypothetical protein ACTSUR_02600 [Candidatus Heimdallarchaeaceae archaeon]
MVDYMVEVGLFLFLIFIAISIMVAIRAAVKSQKRQKVPRRRYRPYQPQIIQQPRETEERPYVDRTPYSSTQQTFLDSRAAYASADEFYRAGMYDRAKEEYLKTGRIFGAAKSVASKGKEFVSEALEIISRYAPEREEEMVRNLSRYFFDSGETETSAIILSEHGLTDEADAVLATIGKTIDDIKLSGVVEVGTIDPIVSDVEAVTTEEETEAVSSTIEVKEVKDVTKEKTEQVRIKGPQPLKVATSDLDERCTVCMSPIKAGDSFVRCPFCDAPSHYAHIIEWIKVKPQCPNCRKKLVSKMFQD